MSETVIRIDENGKITVERDSSGVKSFKQIAPDTLIQCINKSLLRGAVHSGLLPKNCISFSTYDDGCKSISMIHSENRADISYFGTEYKNFPLPRLVFGFRLTNEGRINGCKLGVTENVEVLKPDTKMYYYPFSNVNGFHLCTGNNALPKYSSLHTLASLPYYIISMPNNNDYFNNSHNKPMLEMRNLLELLKDKNRDFYYSDILIPIGLTLNDFIKE
ncbi:MAG: prokaryotic E2 ligase family D protein [Eubacterium sp.]|nr:prokaryotic E2 ligase family D protein [Eubacterium sp.]